MYLINNYTEAEEYLPGSRLNFPKVHSAIVTVLLRKYRGSLVLLISYGHSRCHSAFRTDIAWFCFLESSLTKKKTRKIELWQL